MLLFTLTIDTSGSSLSACSTNKHGTVSCPVHSHMTHTFLDIGQGAYLSASLGSTIQDSGLQFDSLKFIIFMAHDVRLADL